MTDGRRRLRPLAWFGCALVAVACTAVLGWTALAIYFDLAPGGPTWLRAALALLAPGGALAALLFVRPRRWVVVGIAVAFVAVLVAWLAIPPSHARDWQPDVVRLRTNYRGEDVYVYRLDVTPADARRLLLRYFTAINGLRERPEWYNALTENCTTAIRRIVGSDTRRSWWSWKLFLNGRLDELAYDIGAVDRSLPFPDLRTKSHVNDRAKAADADPQFSARIREGLPRMSPP
jgi:hypothetical protein